MDNEWKEVLAPTDMRVAALDGANIVLLQANVPTLVPPSVFTAAMAAGCSVPGGPAGQTVSHEEIVERLVTAMRVIITDNKDAQITKTGEPRFHALKMHVQNFTDEQRVEAWDKYLAESTAPDSTED